MQIQPQDAIRAVKQSANKQIRLLAALTCNRKLSLIELEPAGCYVGEEHLG